MFNRLVMKKRLRLALIVICLLVLAWLRFFSPEDAWICDGSEFSCSWWALLTQSLLPIQQIPMKISTDFVDNGSIPSVYTCDGDGRFPLLSLEDIPADAKSLALIVYDPDAPAGVRDHMLLANIPLDGTGALVISQESFDQWVLGQNGWWEQARWAPCPPSWTHRYVFKVYALSRMLEISSGFSKERLLEMLWGIVVAQSQITGLYTRQ